MVGRLVEVEHVVALDAELVLIHAGHDLAVLPLEVACDRYRERGHEFRRDRAQHVHRLVEGVEGRGRAVVHRVPERGHVVAHAPGRVDPVVAVRNHDVGQETLHVLVQSAEDRPEHVHGEAEPREVDADRAGAPLPARSYVRGDGLHHDIPRHPLREYLVAVLVDYDQAGVNPLRQPLVRLRASYPEHKISLVD